ncbi:hypothetical protein P7C70_g4738, partial [Phenoliferia sp. Uapishka_3]
MAIKAVIFDIGGVVLGSPLVGVNIYEREHNLPIDYLNAAITAGGQDGAFQKLERGELELGVFYERFGAELGDTKKGKAAYREFCIKKGLECPQLPEKLIIDGQELWTVMMAQATEPDYAIVTAINHLRLSKRFKIGALTNNFVVPGETPPTPPSPSAPSISKPSRPISVDELREAVAEATRNPEAKGAPTYLLRSLFDEFVESAVVGMRKPDPRFYQVALDKLGVKANEAVFLDDIGQSAMMSRVFDSPRRHLGRCAAISVLHFFDGEEGGRLVGASGSDSARPFLSGQGLTFFSRADSFLSAALNVGSMERLLLLALTVRGGVGSWSAAKKKRPVSLRHKRRQVASNVRLDGPSGLTFFSVSRGAQ